MKKIGIFLLLLSFGLGFAEKSEAAQPIQQQTIKGVKDPTWLGDMGVSRGRLHDRQDLGFILRKNTLLRVRQSNPNFKGNVTIRLLGNDKKVEKELKVGQIWTTISAPADLVPFIDSPFGDTSATIEYQVDSYQAPKKLPIYQLNGNTQSFFQTWDQQDSEYALIKGKQFQMFAPKKDKSSLKYLKDFSSLNEMIQYFDGIFDFNDKLIGLDNSSAIHQRPDTRYFIKADINGAGYAYYGSFWTALSKDEIAEMWLTKNHWGTLHEIAHGYQAKFDDQGMYTGEVSNNLFGVQYQYEKLGKEKADRNGWLFDYGNRNKIDNELYQELVRSNKGYNEINDLRLKLLMLSLLKQKAGNEAFTKLYKEYRELSAKDKETANLQSYPLLMQKYYSETNKMDATPILEKWKLETSTVQGELNRAKGYTPFAPLAYIVPEYQLPAARRLTDNSMLINSNFQMVNNQDIASLGLKGSLTVKLNTNGLASLNNQKIYLKEGKKVVKEATIKSNSNTITFNDVPNGVYTVEAPTSVNGETYVQEQYYAFVKEQNNTFELTLNKAKSSSIADDTFKFAGLSDTIFATVKMDNAKQELQFDLDSDTPHSFFPNETYVSLQVKDQKGAVVQTITVKGTNEKPRKVITSMKEGYTLSIFHAETRTRLLSSENIINKNLKTNQFVLTKHGLKNTTFDHNPETNLMKKIDNNAQLILKNPELESFQKSGIKYQLWAAIQLLNEPHKKNYLEKYKEIFDTPTTIEKDYTIDFKGYADRTFATLNLNTEKPSASLQTQKGIPHYYFDDNYGTILIQNEKGEPTFKKEYVGSKELEEEIETLPLKISDYITVTHKEAKNRLMIFKQPSKQPLETGETITYQVTADGLVKASAPAIPPSKEPEFSKQVDVTFKGLSDEVFATMAIDLEKNNATIETKAKRPHWYFEEQYAAILIQDSAGKKRFDKEFIGRTIYPQTTETTEIQLNDYITISHKEWQNRLDIIEQPNKQALETNETITYQVTSKGLVKATAPPVEEPKPVQQVVNFKFNGYNDETFATMDVDLNSKKATIQRNNVMPHYNFNAFYASVILKSETGKIKYRQEFIGNVHYSALQRSFTFGLNDTITVMHKEWQNRLFVTSDNQTMETGLTTTYKVTENGLQVVK
ncbi:putative mucin/carbohydrate-binding domain-containing protein [Enterococcus quebecensis]|uniref:Peptidase M60 domain-containing protein n=1 Tax=Enterococcus quebecensis TaxID=903983 RepID=A0A1E5H4J2_9ENTE|nr:putative mucin/carbohydrate-binding domain-containing protein [Enterococcus quebecensis]OEG19600.1 hypothetical protein BCR23_02600 [Enterococcus quebecensis]OJG75120.1 hypothetical protein RV12_GL001725 [Enterococcus quebecensis]